MHTRSSRWFRWTLGCLLLVGIALRIAYNDNQYNNRDEEIARAVVRNLSFPGQWDTNWAKSEVSPVFRYDQYNFSSFHYTLYGWKSLLSAVGLDWPEHLAPWRSINGLFGAVLILGLAMSLRRKVGERAGIAAAAAGALMPLFVQDAHYLRAEAMMSAGVTFLLWSALSPAPWNRWLLVVVGLLAGWLVACKVTMVLALPLLVAGLIDPSIGPGERWKSVCTRGALIALGVIAGFTLGVPFGVIHPQVYLSGLATLSQYYNAPWPPNTTPDMAPSYLITLAYLKGIMGWGFWALAIMGIVQLYRRLDWWRLTLLGLPLVASFFVFGSHAVFAERNFSPFLPVAMVLFGSGIHLGLDAVTGYRPAAARQQPLMLAVVLAVTLILPSVYSWQIVYQGFSGREQVAKDDALARIKGGHAGKKLMMYSPNLYAENYREISATIATKQPMLIIVVDFYDDYTPDCVVTLLGSFGGRVLGVRESIFSDLPTCSLHTLISPRLWLVYIPAQ